MVVVDAPSGHFLLASKLAPSIDAPRRLLASAHFPFGFTRLSRTYCYHRRLPFSTSIQLNKGYQLLYPEPDSNGERNLSSASAKRPTPNPANNLLRSIKELLVDHEAQKQPHESNNTKAESTRSFKSSIDSRIREVSTVFGRNPYKDHQRLGGNKAQNIDSDEEGLERVYKSPVIDAYAIKRGAYQEHEWFTQEQRCLKDILAKDSLRINPRGYHILFKPEGSTGALPEYGKELLNLRHIMRNFIQVVTTPTADCQGTTLLLHFDNKRYLVGSLGEGTSRACGQLGARLLKVGDIFITGRTEWRNVGGLVGMMLTLADGIKGSLAQYEESMKGKSGTNKRKEKELVKPTLTLWGPPNLNHVIATCRRFVFRTQIPLRAVEFRNEAREQWDPDWADENIRVWAMAINPKKTVNGNLSPRKRSWEESNAEESQEKQREIEEREDQIRKGVVNDMFNSSWRLDTLVEMRLKDVQLPAVIFVRDPQTKKTAKYDGPLPGGKKPVPNPDLPVLVRLPWPGALVRDLPPTKPKEEAISYIIKNHPQRGKFDPKKAQALNIGNRKLWGELTKGNNVKNDNGETITPDMVLGEGKEGGGVAVLDMPTLDYVEPLLTREEWNNKEVMSGVGSFVWILGPGVGNSPDLRRFMEERKEFIHLVSSTDYCPNGLTFTSSAKSTLALKQVDPDRYPMPIFDYETTPQNQASIPLPLPDFAIPAQRGHVIGLAPSIQLETDKIFAQLTPESALEDIDLGPESEIKRAAERASQDLESATVRKQLVDWRSKIPSVDAEITTLGTGSASPSRYRNVSSTLLRVPGYGSYLFDSGENTVGQLRRTYSPAEFDEIMKDLRMIWISHMHADHHIGTTSVIRAWYQIVHGSTPTQPLNPSLVNSLETLPDLLRRDKMLAVVSDDAMHQWLAEYSSVEDFGYSRLAPLNITNNTIQDGKEHKSQLFWSHAAYPRTQVSPSAVLDPLLGLKDIQAAGVQHCHGAKGISLTFDNGFKASYSGDCRPSSHFARIGKDTTVLIHEATFDDELQGDAIAKKHSTTSEALGVGEAMGAKAVVLTHFSQRYQKIPVMETVDDDGSAQVATSEPMLEDGDEDMADADAPIEADGIPKAQPVGNAENGTDPVKPSDGIPEGEKQTVIKIRNKDMKVCVAFDYMRVKVGDIAKMEYYTPALVKLFAEEEEEDVTAPAEEAAAKKAAEGGEGKAARKKSKRNN